MKPYRTKDIFLAAYLHMHTKNTLISVERVQPPLFIFERTAEVNRLSKQYYKGSSIANVRNLKNAVSDLRVLSKIKDDAPSI